MKRNDKIKAHDGMRCIKCGKELYSYDEYYIIKCNKKVSDHFVRIHKTCYEKVFPKNKNYGNS